MRSIQAVQPAINKKMKTNYNNLQKEKNEIHTKKSGNVQFSTQNQIKSKKIKRKGHYVHTCPIFHAKSSQISKKSNFFHAKFGEKQKKVYHYCKCPVFLGKSKIIFYLVAYLSSYHKKAINALYQLALELPAICLPHQDGGILPSAFPNATSKLAGLFSTLSLYC